MAIRYLWPDSPTGVGTSPSISTSTVYAVAFVPAADVYLRSIRWYRSQTGTIGKVDGIAVWDTTTLNAVASTASPTDDGTVGWQESFVGSTVLLASGREYRVGFYVVGGSVRQVAYKTATTTPGTSLSWASTVRRFNQPDFAYPGSTNGASEYELADVGVDDTPPSGGTGTVTGGTDSALLSWLVSTNDNQHKAGDAQPGLPWLSQVILEGLRDGTTTYLTQLKNQTDAIKLITDALPGGTGEIADRLVAWESGRLDDLIARLNGDVQPKLALDPVSGTTETGNALTDLYNRLSVLLVSAGSSFPAVWNEGATQAFDTSLEWSEPADRYTAVFSDLGSNIANLTIGGTAISYRLAWWAPLADGYIAQRRFIDAPLAYLDDNGRRMSGLVLHSPAGATGSVTAWNLA